ncbi:MAG TPA: hypothetical protein VJV87_03400, partial [Sphingomicrobium sp.]|nr:hypothetical protein [Sphingomicrobium sp.]
MMVDAGIEQPAIGLDAEIVTGQQIGNEQAAGAQRAAADVEQTMRLAQAKRGQQIELHCADEVVLVLGADVVAVVVEILASAHRHLRLQSGFHGRRGKSSLRKQRNT